MTPRARLEAILSAALRAVDARDAVSRALVAGGGGAPLEIAGEPLDAAARLVVLALGKAACAMAERVEQIAGSRIAAGLAVTKDAHTLALRRLPVCETGHPVPDSRGEAAARSALALAAAASPDDCLLVLLSGGTSALTACPAPGLSLDDLAATTRVLLACGADIHEMNAVRKHLSCFSGGQLARAARCRRIEVLAISDVPGDSIDAIGSGPCAPDPTTYRDALAALRRHGALGSVPSAVREHLEHGASGALAETPGPEDPVFARVRHTIVARNADARAAAVSRAASLGLQPLDLGELLAGEARERGAELALRAVRARRDAPSCWIAGGETVVTLRGPGLGGRSQELALAAAIALDEARDEDISLLAAGTDGSDGPTDAAGAFVDAGTVARGARAGADARRALAANDSNGFFAREGGLVRTGPTGTNVMDLVLVELR